MTRRIGVFGAGAIGSVMGGLLTPAGFDVTLVDQWADHVEAMRRNGLQLKGLSEQAEATTGKWAGRPTGHDRVDGELLPVMARSRAGSMLSLIAASTQDRSVPDSDNAR